MKTPTLDQARLILRILHKNIHRRQETPLAAGRPEKSQMRLEQNEPTHAQGSLAKAEEWKSEVKTPAANQASGAARPGSLGAKEGSESMITGANQAGNPTPISIDILHRPKTQEMLDGELEHYQQLAQAGPRGFDTSFDSLANERLVFTRSLQSESCFSRLGGSSSWTESDECWICNKHQHVVFLYEVGVEDVEDCAGAAVTLKISVPFHGDQFSRKIELFDQDLLMVDSITEDDVAIENQVKSLLRQESSRKRRLAARQQSSSVSDRIGRMTSGKRLKQWIRREAEVHNHINTVTFAEFPVECDDASREGLPTKWFAGMFIMKPNVKFDLTLSCKNGHEVVREDTFEYMTGPRTLPVRTEILSMPDLANLSVQLAAQAKEVGSHVKRKKPSGPEPGQQMAFTPKEQAESFSAFSLRRYSELLDESILSDGRLFLKILLDQDEKEGRVRRASEQDLERSVIEELIDARYETAALTDLAVAEFKKQLLEYYPYITALYAECVSLVDAERYPIVQEAEVISVAETHGLVNKGTKKGVRR